MKEFYVYALLDTRYPHKPVFYIGKGKGLRANSHALESQQRFHKNTMKINKVKAIQNAGHEHEVFYIKNDMSEKDAHKLEVDLIAFYGRIDIGTGSLTNMTDGGDGQSGRKWTDEQRKRFSEKKKQLCQDPEHKRRASEAQKKRYAKPGAHEKMQEAAKNRPKTEKYLKAMKKAGEKRRGMKIPGHSKRQSESMKRVWTERKRKTEQNI